MPGSCTALALACAAPTVFENSSTSKIIAATDLIPTSRQTVSDDFCELEADMSSLQTSAVLFSRLGAVRLLCPLVYLNGQIFICIDSILLTFFLKSSDKCHKFTEME